MSLETLHATVSSIAGMFGDRVIPPETTSFSRLSGEVQDAIVDAMLTPDGETVSVSAEVKAEIQAWADAEE